MRIQLWSKMEEFDVQLNGSLLKVRRVGQFPNARVIVFLHDSFGCIRLWRDFPERLCAAVECNGLIYDRQGYGGSSPFSKPRQIDYLEREADVLIDLLNKVGVDGADCILFGHSDGGSIALIAAAKMAELSATESAAASATESAARSNFLALITEGAHVFVENRTLDGIRKAIEQKDALIRRLSRYHGEKTEAVFSAWADTWLSPGFATFNIEAFLPRIVSPLLVIQGEEDEYGTEEQVNAIVRQSARAQKCMIAAVGHTPHKDALDQTVAAVQQFLSPSLI